MDEMTEGYLDGYDPHSPMPSDNRSASYIHGFANGRDDRRNSPRALAATLRAQAEIARKIDAQRMEGRR